MEDDKDLPVRGSGQPDLDVSTPGSHAPGVRFDVLGRMRARTTSAPDETDAIALGGPKQQMVLALLLADPNRTVSTDALVDGLWGDAPPASARHTVQGYVSELRRSVGDAIQRDGSGYIARVDAKGLDSLEFEALISAGQSGLSTDPDSASGLLQEALALWRGTPFDGLDDTGPLDVERRRLEELRLTALEDRIDADLLLARHGEIAGELESLTTEHPYRERFRAQQMMALYRAGRQADALRAYQRTRAVLADELGIEPSPGLRRLEEQILVQDPELDLMVPAEQAFDPTGAVYNPYKGLRAFTEDDADDFFGRDALIERLEATVTGGAPFVTLVGPSGSGKSSLMRAGLAPALRRHDATGTTWTVATMLPGAHPYAELEAALLRALDDPPATLIDQLTDGETGLLRTVLRQLRSDNERLLVLIDQFEELFTLVDAEVRDEFLASLVAAVDDPRGRVQVVVTLRADFYEQPLLYADVARLMTGSVFNITPLDPDSLEAAAVGPSNRMGVGFESGLLAALVSDVAGQPNALPLFQYTLTELFDRRDESMLTLAAYRELGGLRRAVAVGAEETYQRLDANQREAAVQLFLRMVTVAGDTATRRRVTAAELLSLDTDVVAMQAAVEAFAQHRLLTLDRDPASEAPVVELAHEALLTEWDRLHGWIERDGESLRRYPAFSSAVEEWLTSGRDPDYLLSGGRLDDYEQWRSSCPMRLTTAERHYLGEAAERRDAAVAAEDARIAEQDRLHRRARRTNTALVGLVVMLVAAAIGGFVIATGGDSGPSVAALQRAGSADDDQVGELFEQGLILAEEDHGVEVDRLDVLLSAAETVGQLRADLVLLDTETYLELFFEGQLDLLEPGSHYIVPVRPDLWPGLANVTVTAFQEQEIGFLAGIAAAETSRTGTVGYVGGSFVNERFRAGFEAGARRIDPDISVLAAQISDFGSTLPFDDEATGRAVAARLYEAGADVVFHAAGRSGFGVFDAARALSADDAHLWAIGVDTDQWQTATEQERAHILTSITKRVDREFYELVGDFVDGTLRGGVVESGIANDMVDFSESGGHLSATALGELDSAVEAVREGLVEVPTFPTGPMIGPDPVHELLVAFDGEACTLDGPTAITTDQPIAFRFVNTSADFAALSAESRVPPVIYFLDLPADAGAEATRSVTLQAATFELSVFDPASDELLARCGRLAVGSAD